MWKATQDQVDNPTFKAFSRATTNRLIFREQAASPIKRAAEFYQPGVPQEPNGTTVTILLNFDHELEDRSGKKNHAIFEFTNDQLLFTEGKDSSLNFAVNFNPSSNDTFDKLWIPFSDTSQVVYDTTTGFSVFTRIMPTVITPIGQIASPVLTTNRIKYFGGVVLNKYQVEINNIFWSNEWNDTSASVRSNAGGGTINASSVRSQMINTIMPTIANSDHYKGMWSYDSKFKGIKLGNNITWNDTPLPGSSGTDTTLEDGSRVVQDCVQAGVVPNYDNFGEVVTDKDGNAIPSLGGARADYQHIYFIHIPVSRGLLGAAGVSWKSFTNEYGGTPGTVWFHYCMLTYYDDPVTAPLTTAQSAGQSWGHEIFHQLVGDTWGSCAAPAGFGWGKAPGECVWVQHPLSDGQNCGGELSRLSGTDVYTEHYWSDVDGKCIAPGSGESWTSAPVQTGPIIRRYIFQKMDDLDNGATAAIGDNGAVYFNVKKAGIEYKIKSAPGAVITNQWTDIWFIWDNVTNTPTMYINNTLHNIGSTEALTWNNTHSHFILGNRNLGQSLGQYRGRMDDFRLYRNAVVTTQQVQNLNNNGLSVTGIENNEREAVFIVNRIKIDSELANTGVHVTADAEAADVPAAISSFTTTSFTTTSFTL